MGRKRRNISVEDVIGVHPSGDTFGGCLMSNDSETDSGVSHRGLFLENDSMPSMTSQLREALIKHHGSFEQYEEKRRTKEHFEKLGYPTSELVPKLFPVADTTRKGNLAEIFLAEYLVSDSSTTLPVYRLRYNPNVEQAMKGDDVLAFDFESDRIRIIVGEAKFRSSPTAAVVAEAVEGLVRSHKAGLPISLQFVASRLFEQGNVELGRKVLDCAILIVQNKLDLFYVGLLMGNQNSEHNVNKLKENPLRNLIMISLGVNEPNKLVENCYDNIEEEAVNDDSC